MNETALLPDEKVIRRIILLRNKKVILDFDLAELYGTETKQLKRQVKRNIERFPEDFMFELTEEEQNNLRRQIGTSNWGGTRYASMAFTEQGVAMLSSVLKSAQAIAVNIQIIRVFSRMRELLFTHQDILLKLEKLEKKLLIQDDHNEQVQREIQMIFLTLKNLLDQPNPGRTNIGYKQEKGRG
jgi:hypothetical protein